LKFFPRNTGMFSPFRDDLLETFDTNLRRRRGTPSTTHA
jgi:hypothetical protein